MIRTQVYLTENINQKIKLAALQEKKAEAQVIRETLEEGFAHKAPRRNTGGLLEIAALGKKLGIHLEPDFSANIDDYLYGDTK